MTTKLERWSVVAPPTADNGNPWRVIDGERQTVAIVPNSPREARARLIASAPDLTAEVERLRAALTEITDLDLEGDASLADAMTIADEALNPPPLGRHIDG